MNEEAKPAGPPGKIDVDQLRRLVNAGSTTRAIAAFFGVQTPAVTRACHSAGIALPAAPDQPPRATGSRAGMTKPRKPKTGPAPVPTASTGDPSTDALIATGGRYADLNLWAQAWGMSVTQARQKWFALRRPTEPKKGG
jgi:hypothetical protein